MIIGLATATQSSGSVQILFGSNASVLTPVSDLNEDTSNSLQIGVLKSLCSALVTPTLNAWMGVECESAAL